MDHSAIARTCGHTVVVHLLQWEHVISLLRKHIINRTFHEPAAHDDYCCPLQRSIAPYEAPRLSTVCSPRILQPVARHYAIECKIAVPGSVARKKIMNFSHCLTMRLRFLVASRFQHMLQPKGTADRGRCQNPIDTFLCNWIKITILQDTSSPCRFTRSRRVYKSF